MVEKYKAEDAGSDGLEKGADRNLNVMYSNKTSSTLFQYDFTEPVKPENHVIDILSPVDVPRFRELDTQDTKKIDDISLLAIDI